MGKHKNTTKGGCDAQKGISPPSSHASEAGNTGDDVHDLREEVASLEEELSQMGVSSKIPFCFAQCHLNHFHHLSINKVAQHKKIGLSIASKLRVTLGQGGGYQPPTPKHGPVC